MSDFTAREFFEQHLTQALKDFSEEDADGTLAFAITGAGEWTVDLGKHTVVEGFDKKASFTLRMPEADFAAMIAGEFDAEKAIAAGRMQTTGDVAMLAAFSMLIEPFANDAE
jgi:putative sterol carrier protein